MVPSMEMVRLVNSGTEATMSALRLARGFTGRDLTVKFEGCYHGHVDSLLVKAGSGMATLGIADTAGVPEAFAATTIALPFNSIAAVEQAFAERGDEIAAVIVEPVVGNMGCVPPAPGFLEALRELTARHGALLIFDEVMTGFRVALGGAQQRYRYPPGSDDARQNHRRRLAASAAYGGRADIMKKVAPLGPVYQAGTLSGNPLAVAAGLAMLRYLSAHPEFTNVLEARAAQLCAWTPPGVTVNRVGSMFTFFFTPKSGDRLGIGQAQRHRPLRRSSSTSCWSAASTWRPRNSRPASSRRRTAKKTFASRWRPRVSFSTTRDFDSKDPQTKGLCDTCVFCRVIRSDRGSVFYLCEKSFTDSSFPKYPRLPVLECAGYRPVEP